MLSDEELTDLWQQGESERVEFKESASDGEKLRQTVCAYANDLPGSGQPGVVFVGINDQGRCAGTTISDDLLLRLGQMKDDGAITPFPSLTVGKRCLQGCEVAVVEVQPSHTLPVRYKGRVWVRSGPRRAPATPDEERRLIERQRHFSLPFDAREEPSVGLDELDAGYVRSEYLPQTVAPEVLQQNQRSVEDQLRALHFVGPAGAATHVGLLVAGRAPQDWLPGAYVQFLRFEGTGLTDPVRDEQQVTGRVAEVIRRTEELLQAHNQVAVSFAALPVEERRAEYPLTALQQIFRNAIMHRNYEGTNAPCRIYWYADRIEISSPGGPFGRVNQANFGQPHATDYRNPTLTEAMKNLGFVQRFGAGIALAQAAMQSNGNPPIQFEVEASGVLATLRRGAS